MFDAAFFQTVFPERVRLECEARSDLIPVVELHLVDGAKLDVCHIVYLSDGWLAVACFRDPQTCPDLDTTFLPYGLIARISVSLHPRSKRELGFSAPDKQSKVVEG